MISGALRTLLALAFVGAPSASRPPPSPAPEGSESDESVDADETADPEGPLPVGVLSEGGRNRGAVELTLGSATLAVSAAMIAFGIVELVRGVDRQSVCDQQYDQICDTDPPKFLYVAGGLSLGLSIPVLIGGSFLMARGTKIHRDFRAVRAAEGAQLSVWVARRSEGAGLRFSLRF